MQNWDAPGFAGWKQNNPNNAEHKLEVGHKSFKAACSIQQALFSMSPLFILHGSEPNTPNSKLCVDDVVFAPISISNLPSTTKDDVINKGGWWAEYYRGDFETKVASGEVLGQTLWSGLDQNWTENKETAPSELQGEFDNFSVQLFAKRNLKPGKYLFTVMADDRIRVKVNNQEIITAWYEGSFGRKKECQLSGGEYNIVIYYKNDTGAAAIQLNWEYMAN